MGPNLFTAITHDVHAWHKKRVAGAFSMAAIRSMEHIIDDRVQEFQVKIREQAGTGQRFDFAQWVQ